MRYYFVRHGIAEDLSSSDFARELTKRGRKRVAASAKVIRKLGMQPAVIYSSPRLRALQTAQIIAAALKRDVTVDDRLNFGFDIEDVQSLARNGSPNDEIMFVGHNPDMSLLVNELTGSEIAMKKGGLARIDVINGGAECGELIWLIAPKVFDALSKQSGETLGAVSPLPDKPADTGSELQSLIKRRWSPLGFDPTKPIETSTLLSIMEAARWAASNYNMQPWRFIVAPRENKEEFDKTLSVLREGNQTWAQHAALLVIAVAHKWGHGGAPNRHASHDLGQAIAQMVLQALDHGVYAHQMAGFYPEKARELYGIPEDFEPTTAIALGYRSDDISHLSDYHQDREAAPRQRQALGDMVFSGSWAQSADFLD